MIYRSNLIAPDLQDHFQHVTSRVMPHSMGHDVLSDFADRPEDDPVFGLYKNCGFWTHDEAAILFTIAGAIGGHWMDIGAHTGWTAAHLAAAGCRVSALEPMLRVSEFNDRAEANLSEMIDAANIQLLPYRSDEYFAVVDSAEPEVALRGAVIDGDHEPGHPLADAYDVLKLTNPSVGCVLLFHDFIGEPVWSAVAELMNLGMLCKPYFTPHMVACVWNDPTFRPPAHDRDPRVDWRGVMRTMAGFPFHKCV